jgi:class 3 adenylate cyclase
MSYAMSPTAARRFQELEDSAAARPVVQRLRALVQDGTDLDLYKINAFHWADDLSLNRREVVRAFLFATRMGITDLTWDIHCPSCTGLPDFHAHLMQLQRRTHCGLCELEWDLDFEEHVEVSFTINPDVRPINYRHFHERVYPEHLQFFFEVNGREGRNPLIHGLIHPGRIEFEGRLEPGEYAIEVPGHPDRAGRITVTRSAGSGSALVEVNIHPDGSVTPRRFEIPAGPVRVVGDNAYPVEWGFKVDHAEGVPTRWVSAAYVTALQDFRDLFSGEFLSPDLSFAIRSTTLMFTDIKGSTELYEQLGDAAAYALVQQHFRLMTEVVRRHEGGVVKTIGDAVMASFPSNSEAVAAALEIQLGFAAARPEMELIEVKIGLHRGPTIAVTSNRMMDFFGRTVNIAARVQGESKPHEVLVTEAVLDDPRVQSLLSEKKIDPQRFDANLKGIAGRVQLSSLRPLQNS